MDGELLLNLEHSFDHGDTWKPRGHVSVSNTRSGVSNQDQLSLSQELKDALKVWNELCLDEILKNIYNNCHQAQCEADGLYLLRANVHQSGASLGVMRSFTSACSLVESGMVDIISLQTDHKGKVMSLSLSGGSRTSSPGLRDTFKTKIVTAGMEPGPVPDTAAFIQRLEEEKRRKEKGEVPDNRSFLAKYWMYIVPIVLFMAIKGAAAPEGGS